jgi:hypothetical protein
MIVVIIVYNILIIHKIIVFIDISLNIIKHQLSNIDYLLVF